MSLMILAIQVDTMGKDRGIHGCIVPAFRRRLRSGYQTDLELLTSSLGYEVEYDEYGSEDEVERDNFLDSIYGDTMDFTWSSHEGDSFQAVELEEVL